jgi:glutathionylspermidine amidase/synthetase
MNNWKTTYRNTGGDVPAPFAAVCGVAPGGIPAYSCDYETADTSVWRSRHQFRHENDGLYYGYRYQCVEFSRRWLIHAQGVTFGDVGMAYEIFHLPFAEKISDGTKIPWNNIPNGSSPRPVPGSVLIWDEGGEFRHTGHVAIVTEVSDNWVRIAEQNVDDTFWPEGRDYARELRVDYDPVNDTYHIHEVWGRHGGVVLGWKSLPTDFVPEPIPHP